MTSPKAAGGKDQQLVLSMKAVFAGSAAVLALFSGVQAVFAAWIMPSIMDDVEARVEHHIDRHAAVAHPDAVTRAEFEHRWGDIMKQLEKLATKEGQTAIRGQLSGLESRLRDLEKRVNDK